MTTAYQRPIAQVTPGEIAYSLIIPVYNEEGNLTPLHERVTAAMAELPGRYELILVDDGSRDGSAEELAAIAARDPRVKVVQFRRNFGQTAAMSAGIDHSRGDVLVFLDADLQNDPADIPRLIAELNEGNGGKGYDVVSGWRKDRQDAFITRTFPSRLANGLISWGTGVYLHDYGCSLKAYRREVLEQVHLYGEMHRFIPAYAALVGATITELPVQHHARVRGKSKYGLNRTVKVVLDLLTAKFMASYATKPIYVFGGIGMLLLALGAACILLAVLQKLFLGVSLIQTPLTLLSAILGATGFIAILQGLNAEVAVRTYHESQGKPIYTVKRVLNGDPPQALPPADAAPSGQ